MSDPTPAKLVATVRVFVLVRAIAVVILGIDSVPVRTWALVVKECEPEPAVNVPVELFVMPPLNSTSEFPELFHVAPLAIVTKPVNILAPVAEEIVRPPLDPPPTAVVPVIVVAYPAIVNVVPLPMTRLPETESPAPVVAVALPLNVKFPATVVIAPNVSAPPERVK